MIRKRRWFVWGAAGALFFALIWDRPKPWVVMFQPSRAERLLTEWDHRLLFGRVTQ